MSLPTILHRTVVPTEKQPGMILESLGGWPDSRVQTHPRCGVPHVHPTRRMRRGTAHSDRVCSLAGNENRGAAASSPTTLPRLDQRNQLQRSDDLRRALTRPRITDNTTPAEPKRARTTVGSSGESSQPVWARRANAQANNRTAISTLYRNFINPS